MLNWFITTAVLIIGFFIMVTGVIEYLFVGWLVMLVVCLITEVLNNIRK